MKYMPGAVKICSADRLTPLHSMVTQTLWESIWHVLSGNAYGNTVTTQHVNQVFSGAQDRVFYTM